jgi:predicted amidohydrolase
MILSTVAAAIQYAPKLLDPQANLNTALQMTFEAAAKGAKLIVLPELAMSGYVLENKREAAMCAQQRDGYQTMALQEIAARYNCYIALGYVELDEGVFYNSAALIGPQGCVGNTRKRNLYGSDFMWAKAADDQVSPVISTPFGRVGLMVCRDVTNKQRNTYAFKNENYSFYRKGSVDHVCLLTNWAHDYGFPDASWVGLAEQLGANVVVSNRCGVERDMMFKGGSAIIDKTLHVWTHGSTFNEACVVGGALLV